jgi:3-oxoacyl-(acyl-carrier-protein) synthase
LGVNLLREKQFGEIGQVLSNNFAFGGMNTSLIISAVR